MRKPVAILLTAVAVYASVPVHALEAAPKAAVIEPMGSARPANVQGEYAALRAALPGASGVTVKDLTLQREGATFTFTSGTFYFYSAVNNRATGAVFVGQGRFHMAAADASERRSLALLTKGGDLDQTFTTLLLRFTDGTAEEIGKAAVGKTGPSTEAAQVGAEAAKSFRHKLHENLELRLLEDVLPNRTGAFFLASFRMGGVFSGHNILFVIDPDSSPDQVELSTWDDFSFDTWAASAMKSGDASLRGVPLHIVDEKPDVTFERSGNLSASTETTLTVARDQTRVLPLKLYPKLRVAGVYDEQGRPLDFVQENKDEDPQFAVVLAQPAKAGESVRLLTRYAGKEALMHDGDGMYYLMGGARDSWYPAGNNEFGDFATFRMTFHLPKYLQIVATGKEVSRDAEGSGTRVVWATEKPIPVAGFNLGEFKSLDKKTPAGFVVTSYANTELPDSVAPLANQGTLGSLSAPLMLKSQVEQGAAAIQIYTDFFGPLPFDHVALTEQSACNYGQSWPMLVYLPMCAFWDDTARHGLGLDSRNATYWEEVTPHEVAHQWWGSLVGFASYRDQWMSEGFANFSTALYLRQTEKTMDKYRSFWKEQRKNLLEKNANGKRPIDVGPITMGYRVNNTKTGDWVAQELLYSKGAYVLHMLEMLYWTPKSGETPFREALKRFAQENAGRAASTEDFKRAFEKNLPPWMDLDHNGKLDWYFNEWVYGTAIPRYTVDADFTVADGETSMHLKLAQSNVDKDFVMLVPIYLQMENGTTLRLGAAVISGNNVYDKTVKLGKLPSPAKKLLLNVNGDVLSE